MKGEKMWIIKGRKLEILKNYDRAIYCYKQSLLFNPTGKEGLWGLARCYYRLGEYKKSLDTIYRIQKAHPDDLGAVYAEGTIMHKLGHYNTAIRCFNHIIRCKPTAYNAMEAKARVLEKIGDYYGAIKEYRRALKALKEEDEDRTISYIWSKNETIGGEIL